MNIYVKIFWPVTFLSLLSNCSILENDHRNADKVYRFHLDAATCASSDAERPVRCGPVAAIRNANLADKNRGVGDGNLDAVIRFLPNKILHLATDGRCQEKVSVKPGLCWARAEVGETEAGLRTPASREIWHGISVRLAKLGQGADRFIRERLMVFQYKVAGTEPDMERCEIDRIAGKKKDCSLSPVLALRFENGQLHATTDARFDKKFVPVASGATCPANHLLALRIAENEGPFEVMRVLLAYEGATIPPSFRPAPERQVICTAAIRARISPSFPMIARDRFVRFSAGFRWGPSGDGFAAIYADGKPIMVVDGAIGYFEPESSIYFKFGIYGDFVKGRGVAAEFRDFARAPTRELVE